MSAVIKTYDDLEKEKLRLQATLAYQASLIREDIAIIKEELKPLKLMVGFFGKFLSSNKQSPLIHLGLGIMGDVLMKNLIFGRTGMMAKFAPYVLKGISAKLFPNSGGNILKLLEEKVHQVKALLNRKSS